MAANVLSSSTAVQVSVHVVRAFVSMREMLSVHKDLAGKINALREQYREHDEIINEILAAISELARPPGVQSGQQIGFVSPD